MKSNHADGQHFAKYVVLILIALTGVSVAREKNPKETLQFFLEAPEQRGDVVYQAHLDHFDYRTHLRRAIEGNEQALGAIFAYTLNGKLMGEGSISHGTILTALMQYLGDAAYAGALARQPQRTREIVLAHIDEFGPRDWGKGFPRTYALGKHSIF